MTQPSALNCLRLLLLVASTRFWHSCLTARVKAAWPNAGTADHREGRPGGIMDAFPANIHAQPDGNYMRINLFRFDHSIKKVLSQSSLGTDVAGVGLGDLSFVCSTLWEAKTHAQRGWRLGSLLSVYRADVRLDVLNGKNDDVRLFGAYNEFSVQFRALERQYKAGHADVASASPCRIGDPSLEAAESIIDAQVDYRWYTLKVALSPNASADPNAHWKNAKYVGTLDLAQLFPESSQELLEVSTSSSESVLAVLSHRIFNAFTQEPSFHYGRAHENIPAEKCSDKSLDGDSLGWHSCRSSWSRGRCAWVFQIGWRHKAGFCVPNCEHEVNGKHPELCLASGPCTWDGERCDFDTKKIAELESPDCQSLDVKLTSEQSKFCERAVAESEAK